MNHPNFSNGNRGVFRILDANGNRASEGLRTIEETARFVFQDPERTLAIKSLRHDLATTMSRLPLAELLAARDTPGDVGTALTTTTEQYRGRVHDVVAAACSRVQQSLRVLEEYGKMVDPSLAQSMETIRYRSYAILGDVQRLLMRQNSRRERLASARLYALIDARSSETDFVEHIERLADAGVDLVQLRDRRVSDRTLFERAIAGADAARRFGILMIVNDRADIAAAAGCDGVHVGQDELPVDAVRRIVGDEAIIGLSTHDVDQVNSAIQSDADYIGCGPVFAGTTKQFDHYPGTSFLQAAHSVLVERSFPAFAIGGIDGSNVAEVAATGFCRIAVTSALADVTQLANTAKHLRTVLDSRP